MSKDKRSYTAAIEPDGAISFIYDDALVGLIEKTGAEVTRASRVEPAEGGWTADMSPVGGPVLGPFRLRQDALDAEVAYLNATIFT